MAHKVRLWFYVIEKQTWVSNKTKWLCLYGLQMVARDDTIKWWRLLNETEQYNTIKAYSIQRFICQQLWLSFWLISIYLSIERDTVYTVRFTTVFITSCCPDNSSLVNPVNISLSLWNVLHYHHLSLLPVVGCLAFILWQMLMFACVLKRLGQCFTSAVIACKDANAGLVTAPVTVSSAIDLLSRKLRLLPPVVPDFTTL